MHGAPAEKGKGTRAKAPRRGVPILSERPARREGGCRFWLSACRSDASRANHTPRALGKLIAHSLKSSGSIWSAPRRGARNSPRQPLRPPIERRFDATRTAPDRP
ncbi:hypothetical protein PCLA_12r0125 [Pseudomonas citronellolis]|nr:hypothetical protein PCLA_12r0125 [Pseudomonas citronellolis]